MQNNIYANINKVYVFGTVRNTPKFSHSAFGQDFYKFDLEICRLSGYLDILPITLPKEIINEIKANHAIGAVGQLRSYNIVTKCSSHLILTIFAKKIISESNLQESKNEIYLEGFICKPPIYRITPFKREICDLLVAVNRSYGKSDYIPSIAWGKNALNANEFKTGQKVKIIGRVQSRNYKKVLDNNEEIIKTAYEVSITHIEKI